MRIPRATSAFTLVELIVVITILAILGTIGFLSLQGYSKSARDSERTTDLTNIGKGFDILSAAGKLFPQPDANMLTITASGTTIGYQGYAGKNVISALSLGGKFQDPTDNQYYTYLTNASQTKYQVLALVENPENTSFTLNDTDIPGIQTAYAASYDTRYPLAKGNSLGIFLGTITGSTLNQPLQETYNAVTMTGINITTATGTTFKAYVSPSKILSGTGNVFWELYGRLDTSAGTYPGCDTPNIKLPNGQVWAACNVGATIAYTGQGYPANTAFTDVQKAYLGAYFQWGRNDDVTLQGVPTATPAPSGTTAGAVGHSNFITNGASPYDWLTAPRNDNLWGAGGTTSAIGTFSTQSLSDQILMKGPCQTGYHVPTLVEWFAGIASTTGSAWTDSAWHTDTSFASTLKLPLSGYRDNSNAGYASQGSIGVYWASTPNSTDGFDMYFNSTQIFPLHGNFRTRGYSARCLKN